jgi:hypothetical protein
MKSVRLGQTASREKEQCFANAFSLTVQGCTTIGSTKLW